MKSEKRITISLISFAIVSLLTSIMPFWGLQGEAYFSLTIVLVVLCGLTTANFQNALFGMAAKFPGIFMQAVITGQGAAGIVVSFTNLITTAAKAGSTNDLDKKITACAYFAVAFFFVLLSVFGFIALQKMPIFKYYMGVDKFLNVSSDDIDGKANESSDSLLMEGKESPSISILKVLKEIKWFGISVFFIFFVSLALIPYHHLTATTDTSSQMYMSLFSPLAFFVFDLGDVIGKALPGWPMFFIKSDKLIFALSFARIIFFPLFMFGNIVLQQGPTHTPKVFASDVAFFFIALFHSLSNGYLGSILMIKAPMSVDVEKRERTGSLMTMFLTIGIALGSMFSFALVSVHCNCNPFV